MAVLKPSVNLFALLTDDDPDDTTLVANVTTAGAPTREHQQEAAVRVVHMEGD